MTTAAGNAPGQTYEDAAPDHTARLLEVEVPILDFTRPRTIKIRKGESVISVEFRPRKIEDLVARDKGVKRESQMLAGKESEEHYQDRAGNAILFDLTATKGARASAGGAVEREYNEEECQRFPAHDKDKFVRKLLRVKTTVLDVAFGDDPMLSAEGSAAVRQIFGDPNSPEHVVDYQFQLPGQKARDVYDDATRVRANRGGDKPIYKVVTDLRKAYGVSKGLFVSMQGASGAASDVDPWCLLEAVGALMTKLDEDDEDF